MTGNIGEEDRAEGNYGAARERYLEAHRLARETGHRGFEAAAHHNLGESFTVLGDLESAKQRLEAGSTLAAEVGEALVVGYAARGRADVAAASGDEARAVALYDEALVIARAVKSAPVEAEALAGLGRAHAHAGRTVDATARLQEALEIARRLDEPNTLALAAAIRAALPGGDPSAAAKTLDDLGTRPWHVARMEARFWLWKATNDRAHLLESWRLLKHLRDHAPEENRGTVIANVPLHRDIAAAAKAAGL